MNANKKTTPSRIPAADPVSRVSVCRAIVLYGLTTLALPSEAATVHFSFQEAAAALPVFNGSGLLAIGLVWLAHRDLRKGAIATLG